MMSLLERCVKSDAKIVSVNQVWLMKRFYSVFEICALLAQSRCRYTADDFYSWLGDVLTETSSAHEEDFRDH